jgi:hypothetical protein
MRPNPNRNIQQLERVIHLEEMNINKKRPGLEARPACRV